MAAEQMKRARPVPNGSQGSKKRQKTESTTEVGSDVKRLPVAADSLPWNEVEMPEMFDDAEGFFGLEEIEDVDVVRDGNKIQFVGRYSWPLNSINNNRSQKRKSIHLHSMSSLRVLRTTLLQLKRQALYNQTKHSRRKFLHLKRPKHKRETRRRKERRRS